MWNPQGIFTCFDWWSLSLILSLSIHGVRLLNLRPQFFTGGGSGAYFMRLHGANSEFLFTVRRLPPSSLKSPLGFSFFLSAADHGKLGITISARCAARDSDLQLSISHCLFENDFSVGGKGCSHSRCRWTRWCCFSPCQDSYPYYFSLLYRLLWGSQGGIQVAHWHWACLDEVQFLNKHPADNKYWAHDHCGEPNRIRQTFGYSIRTPFYHASFQAPCAPASSVQR